MIYLVSNQQTLFESEVYKMLSVEDSLAMMNSWGIIQFDTETSGIDCHLDKLLCAQFGNDKADSQIVVDCETVDISLYKELLESKLIIGHNLKFDLQWLYNYKIIPRRVYDTQIVEQLLYLGYPSGVKHYSLKAIAEERLGINIDKTVRGQIIWRGLDTDVILYAAGDVMYLEKIMQSQLQECNKKECFLGAKLECECVPVIAYMEWCGIKLDENKWKAKMAIDQENLKKATDSINEWFIDLAEKDKRFRKWVNLDTQGDLFTGLFNDKPQCMINWGSSDQVVKIAKLLGFNTTIKDKKTGEDKETAIEKHLAAQKGINDEFLKLMFGKDYYDENGKECHYWGYKEASKVCSSFGQGHLDLINPKTGRLHTNYWQIGTRTGRMSSGSGENASIAKAKKLKEVKMVNMQQLPHDNITRACFVSEPGNVFVSCDYAAMEARIGAEVYNEKMLLDEFLLRSGDTHAAYAKAVFSEELKDIPVEEVKKKRPDLRSKVKSVEFAVQFGSDGTAVAPQLKISVEEARQLVTNLLSGMTGLKAFKERGAKEVLKKGYVVLMPQTGHKMYWWDIDVWRARQQSMDSAFWDEYREIHKPAKDSVYQEVKEHFKAKSTWERYALNGPTQGGGAVVTKRASTLLFNWIIDNGYFGAILLCNITHDEINSECPKELGDKWSKIVSEYMEKAAAEFYHKLPIPAEPSVGDHWIH